MNTFVMFSDLHAQKNLSKSYIREDGISSWTWNQIKILDQVFDYARENQVATVIHNGDLFHEKNRIPQDLYNLIWEYFNDKSEDFEIILNCGNHDLFTLTQKSSLKPFSSICTIISVPTEYRGIQFVPHGFDIPAPTYSWICTHEDIAGLQYGPNDRESDSKLDPIFLSEWELVFNGHIHRPQELANIVNIGSPMITDWGEANEQKRFIHLKDNKLYSIPIDGPKFIALPYIDDVVKKKIEDNETDFFRFDVSVEEISDPIFNKWNVGYRITKTKEREIRLIEEDDEGLLLDKYINIADTNLDKDKLLEIGKELL